MKNLLDLVAFELNAKWLASPSGGNLYIAKPTIARRATAGHSREDGNLEKTVSTK